MRRTATTLVLAVAVLAPATAHGKVHPCNDLTHHGYYATGFRQQRIGCGEAHGMAMHIIDHGPAGLHHWTCSPSSLPKNVTLWDCSRSLHGERLTVHFGIRPL
jgi:hypothetical protein